MRIMKTFKADTVVPFYKTTPTAMKKWSYERGGIS
jgi:hypothetical protein